MNLNFDYTLDLTDIMDDGDPVIVTSMYLDSDYGTADGDTYSIDSVDLFNAVDDALDYCTVDGQFGSPEDRDAFQKVAVYLSEVANYAWFLLNTTQTRRPY